MSTKHALIVDDSRIAQIKLRKMLARYDLEVTCVNSAEEALSYLSYKLPAVVFMDHMMEGMDGFEALRVIKSNPDTAMVPIIMYTSKTGDVYVGQARALGAIDVLTKDVIEPSNLDRVLEGVKIFPKFTSESDHPPANQPFDTPATEQAAEHRPAEHRPAEHRADEASILAIDRLRTQIA
ncbi:MAG TPA: response regulator, partial [Gammaproteobacteria bacterium]